MGDISLDLPVPPSVNRSRKVDWAKQAKYRDWQRRADALVLAARTLARRPLPGAYEATIVLSETHTKIDLDNAAKAVLDYARRIGLVVDDSPRYLRCLTIMWGEAPEGCRLILRPIEST